MKKRILKMLLASVFILGAVGCTKTETPPTPKPSEPHLAVETRTSYADTPYTLADLGLKATSIDMGDNRAIDEAPIDKNGNLPIHYNVDGGYALGLYNIDKKSVTKIKQIDTTGDVYGYAYSDDEMLVMYRYHGIDSGRGYPEAYLIYLHPTQEIIEIDLGGKFPEVLAASSHVVRDGNKIYIEKAEMPADGNLQAKLMAIYVFDLGTKELVKITDGYQPHIYDGKLLFLRNDGNAIFSHDLATGVEETFLETPGVGEFTLWKDELLWAAYKVSPQINLYNITSKTTDRIFESDYLPFFGFILTDNYISFAHGKVEGGLYIYSRAKSHFVKVAQNQQLPKSKDKINETTQYRDYGIARSNQYLSWKTEKNIPEANGKGKIENIINYVKIDELLFSS